MDKADDSIELCNILSLLVRAMVRAPDTVHVSSMRTTDGSTLIQIKVESGHDLGKLIGRQGRTAHSLRTIVQAIGKEKGHNYRIDIDVATANPIEGPEEN